MTAAGQGTGLNPGKQMCKAALGLGGPWACEPTRELSSHCGHTNEGVPSSGGLGALSPPPWELLSHLMRQGMGLVPRAPGPATFPQGHEPGDSIIIIIIIIIVTRHCQRGCLM